MFELPPYDTRRYYIDFSGSLDTGDVILPSATKWIIPKTLEVTVDSFDGTEYCLLVKYVGPRDGKDRTLAIECQVFCVPSWPQSNSESESESSSESLQPVETSFTSKLELFVEGHFPRETGHVWYSMAKMMPQVAPQRSISLADPYLELADEHTHPDDYCPHQGESGVEFFYEFKEDISRAIATAKVVGPRTTEYYTAAIRENRASFTTQECTFQYPGRYRIVLSVVFPGGGTRKIGRTIRVSGRC